MTAPLLPTSYFVPGELSSPRVAHAFARGCGGTTSSRFSTLQPGPFAGFCTPPLWPLLDQAVADGRDVYYADHGYYRRGRYYRIAKNAVQYQPTLQELATTSRVRLTICGVTIADRWQTPGRSILICPNSDGYTRRHTGMGATAWIESVTAAIRRVSDRPIIVHAKTQARSVPLASLFPKTWMVVVLSSASAVDALCAGVPIATLAPWAATTQMGISDLRLVETPYYPDNRHLFLAALANHQWTLEEIARGDAWRSLNADTYPQRDPASSGLSRRLPG